MTARDFGLLFAICFVWGLNVVVSALVLVSVPPFFYAGVRFALIALVLAPFLFPPPASLRQVLIVGALGGGTHFALLFLALANGSASEVSIAGQLALPFTTILSMLFLGERIGWRRGLGMGLAFAGVVLIAFKPQAWAFSVGVGLSALAALAASASGVVAKRMPKVGLMQLQAWSAMASWPILGVLSLGTEQNQLDAALALGWPFLAALLFSVFLVSIFGHGLFYWLVQRYEVTLLTPMTLMTPVWAVVFAVLLMGETLTPQLVVGGVLALTGVGIVAARPNMSLKDAVTWWRRVSQG